MKELVFLLSVRLQKLNPIFLKFILEDNSTHVLHVDPFMGYVAKRRR